MYPIRAKNSRKRSGVSGKGGYGENIGGGRGGRPVCQKMAPTPAPSPSIPPAVLSDDKEEEEGVKNMAMIARGRRGRGRH